MFPTLPDDGKGGCFRIGPADGKSGTQRYIPNTNMIETTFHTATGSFREIDFAPRFMHYDRAFRPTQLMCIADLIEGPLLDGADGSQNFEGVVLDHWPGYRGERTVRIATGPRCTR